MRSSSLRSVTPTEPATWTGSSRAFAALLGGEVAELARRSYNDDSVSDDEWARVYAAFGPRVPDKEQRARMVRNAEVGLHGIDLLHRLDVVNQLDRVDCPTLVCVGDLDPGTPVEASREMVDALRPGIGRHEVIAGAGHFPWLDAPAEYWRPIGKFIAAARQ